MAPYPKRKDANRQELWTTSKDGTKVTRFACAEKVINVIGSEQRYLQKIVYYILKLMGYKEYRNLLHLAYEHVWFQEEREVERFSGRAGTWIGYSVDEVLNEAARRAYKEVDKRNPNLLERKKKQIAEKIATAAVRYFMLRTNQDKVIVFDYDKALSFEGDTGPYLQYAHTRICGILRKAGEWKPVIRIKHLSKHEKILIKALCAFPGIVKNAAVDLQPPSVCKYAYYLATTLDKFYEFCPVLKAKTKESRNFRLTLMKATKITLENVFSLIGIVAPGKM